MALKKSSGPKESSAALHQRRIALLGLGVENRALARFLHARQIPFAVCDACDPTIPVEGVQQWRIGEGYLDDLTDFDLLFRTPGLPTLDPRLCEARRCGVEVSSQTRLFLQLCPAPVLGITGTKGKGTTTALLHALLATDSAARVFSGGNIGRPPLEFIDELQATDRVVLELSSFQLQDLDQSPHIAVVLSVAEDHLDYHADRAEYVDAKKPVCRYQTPGDILIVNRDCTTARTFADESPAAHWAFSTTTSSIPGAWIADGQLWACCPGAQPIVICPVADLSLRGQHNWGNAAAAVAGALAFGAPATHFAEALRTFAGLPHRLEYVAERDGVTYYNDSLATTVDATCAAIRAFDAPLLLIAGGASKGGDFSALGTAIAEANVRAALLIGQEAPRIAAAVQRAGSGQLVHCCRDLPQALDIARQLAQLGDVVLLSPACASFDQFASYADRGDLFKRLIRASSVV
ncbi:MAG: UDP-N-acetylmuramoyl-L-alanine--D-glutamate ligase [Gemmatimonadetes bacterium]|nr:UDP-N-acetylmuramoyl-L-alanine--D-glutamate ligase [Gemmatimonadota bacterium]MDE2736719.1 UDP-N-acetylmuramoyl-L-alanine--D-glutamate ligase [Gemmatimonadota bacterium]